MSPQYAACLRQFILIIAHSERTHVLMNSAVISGFTHVTHRTHIILEVTHVSRLMQLLSVQNNNLTPMNQVALILASALLQR